MCNAQLRANQNHILLIKCFQACERRAAWLFETHGAVMTVHLHTWAHLHCLLPFHHLKSVHFLCPWSQCTFQILTVSRAVLIVAMRWPTAHCVNCRVPFEKNTAFLNLMENYFDRSDAEKLQDTRPDRHFQVCASALQRCAFVACDQLAVFTRGVLPSRCMPHWPTVDVRLLHTEVCMCIGPQAQ